MLAAAVKITSRSEFFYGNSGLMVLPLINIFFIGQLRSGLQRNLSITFI